ncbi:16433_t:CDS:1, partial [Cetraspora pellucida]
TSQFLMPISIQKIKPVRKKILCVSKQKTIQKKSPLADFSMSSC